MELIEKTKHKSVCCKRAIYIKIIDGKSVPFCSKCNSDVKISNEAIKRVFETFNS